MRSLRSALLVLTGLAFAGCGHENVTAPEFERAGVWKPAAGLPAGATVFSMASNDSLLFAGLANGGPFDPEPGGVYRSRDGGATWDSLGLAGVDVWTLHLSGHTLLAAGTGAGPQRSIDDGVSWSGLPAPLAGIEVTAFTSIGSTTYAAAWDGAVYRSVDDGASWTATGFQRHGLDLYSLAARGTDLFVTTGHFQPEGYYESDSGFVFRSSDGGTTWTNASSGLPGPEVWSIAVAGTSLLASVAGVGAYRSVDNAASWTPVRDGLTAHYIRNFWARGDTILVASVDEGAFRSIDRGASWTRINDGLGPHPGVFTLRMQGGALVAGLGDTGVWRMPLSDFEWGSRPGTRRDAGMPRVSRSE